MKKRKKEIEETIVQNALKDLKNELDYQIPLAKIEKAGITATGAKCENELETLLKEFRDENFANYFKFIPWNMLENWSAKYYFQKTRDGGNYPLEYLGNILKEEKNKIKPFENPDKEFGILGVNNKIGIFDNEILLGKQIKQPYKIVKNGFLAYNPYRVNVGSIGLKTEEQEFNLISSAYVVFSCKKEKIVPEFMFLIFKTEAFNEMIRSNTKGSVRQTFSYDILSSLQIPLPRIDIQEKIVAEYKDKMAQIEKLKSEIKSIETEVENIF